MAMSWEFIQATEEQAEEIGALVNSAYRGDTAKAGWTHEADLLDGQRTDVRGIREMITAEDSVILVAQNEDAGEGDENGENNDGADREILGCVHLENHDGRCYLGMLTVKPTLQKNGLGGQLLEEAEAFAEFWGCEEIYMTVLEQRTELIRWYQKNGFRLTKEKKPFPSEDRRFGIPKVAGLQFAVLTKKL